jgi:hypothetical protein
LLRALAKVEAAMFGNRGFQKRGAAGQLARGRRLSHRIAPFLRPTAATVVVVLVAAVLEVVLGLVAPQAARAVSAPAAGGVRAAHLTVTAVAPSANASVVVWAQGATQPSVTSLIINAGLDVGNSVITKVDATTGQVP